MAERMPEQYGLFSRRVRAPQDTERINPLSLYLELAEAPYIILR